MASQILWQEEIPLFDNSPTINVLIKDNSTGAVVEISCVDQKHADDLCEELLKAGLELKSGS